MSSARVIIGSGYGDEGKGVFTDYFSSSFGSDAVVVRFNGGAQAGHTVVTPDGRRHVFSHFGSGAFVGARTVLASEFVLNPILFFRERAYLETLGVSSDALHPYIDERAYVTTPYDMLINQIIEIYRGSSRHGSCGLGFGETIERNLHPSFSLSAGELYINFFSLPQRLRNLLQRIKNDWVPRRLAKLGFGLDYQSEAIAPLLLSLQDPLLIERWIEDVLRFSEATSLCQSNFLKLAARDGSLIAEGAQGLLLDQHRGTFPYVTRSNTGIINMVALAQELSISSLDVMYATRFYSTRHGAGPLSHERNGPPNLDILDMTNVSNTFQESFRYGVLDLNILASSIAADLKDADGSSINIRPSLGLTWIDKASSSLQYYDNGKLCLTTANQFIQRLSATTGISDIFVSRGPTRQTVSHLTVPDKFPASSFEMSCSLI